MDDSNTPEATPTDTETRLFTHDILLIIVVLLTIALVGLLIYIFNKLFMKSKPRQNLTLPVHIDYTDSRRSFQFTTDIELGNMSATPYVTPSGTGSEHRKFQAYDIPPPPQTPRIRRHVSAPSNCYTRTPRGDSGFQRQALHASSSTVVSPNLLEDVATVCDAGTRAAERRQQLRYGDLGGGQGRGERRDQGQDIAVRRGSSWIRVRAHGGHESVDTLPRYELPIVTPGCRLNEIRNGMQDNREIDHDRTVRVDSEGKDEGAVRNVDVSTKRDSFSGFDFGFDKA